jgi:anaerobic magnesium-protoporphyrin IX monomethyl ester cyclase
MIVLAEIVVPPDRVYGAKYPPLALACLASALKQAGHPARIVLFEPGTPPERWIKDVLAFDPTVVAFSVFAGYKLEMALLLSRTIKQERPDLPILWGGVLPSIMPEQVLKEPCVDWVCVGPGESTIVALAAALANRGSLSSVPALGWRGSGGIVVNPPPLPRLEPNPARPDWHCFPVEKFIMTGPPGDRTGGRVVCMTTSRGCPHDCGFCYNAGYHGRKWQPAPIDLVKAEMLELRGNSSVNGFSFLDDLFFGNKQRAIDLLDWMAAHGLHVHSLDLRLDEVTPDVLDALRRAHTRHVFLGVESTVDRVLELIDKGSRKAHLLQAVELFRGYPEISLWLSCIVGFPTETFSEMKQTIRGLALLGGRPNTLINLNAFMPFPGTKLFGPALENGFVPPKDLIGWTALTEGRGGSLDHFPGRLTRAQTTYLRRAAHYLSMLYQPYKSPAKGRLSRIARSAFAKLAQWRLAREWLGFPADLWLYRRLQGIYRSIGGA